MWFVKRVAEFGEHAIFLAERLSGDGPSVRIQYVNLVDAVRLSVAVDPRHGLITADFQQLDLIAVRPVAGDHRIAVWQALNSAGVVDRPARQVVVADLPYGLSARIDLDHEVAPGASDDRVAVRQANRGERHVGRFDFPDDFAGRGVFADNPVEQLRNEVIPVFELASHARLQVVIIRLSLERDGLGDMALAVDLEQSRFVAGLGDEVPAFDRLGGIHL